MLAVKVRESLSHLGTERAAADLQRRLAAEVKLRPLPRGVRRVAGAVVREVGGRWWACAALLSFPDLRMVKCSVVPGQGARRYRPGLRAFFEGEVLARALEELGEKPEVIFLRGHGVCHPRRCGLASHLGLVLGWPTVGCAQRLLCGRAEEPGERRGDWSPVVDEEGRVAGAAVRVQQGVRPLYVSPGHLCDVGSAVALTLACAPRFRMPEPLRAARMVEVD